MKLLLVLILTVGLHASLINELYKLNPEQQKVFNQIVAWAEVHDLKWTMLSIAWKESNYGKYRVGKFSEDYGVFQINLRTFKNRFAQQLEAFPLSESSIKKILTTDDELNFLASIAEIKFWHSVHGHNWRKVWGSYNDGTHISYKGREYAQDIARRIKLLKIFLKEKSDD